MLFAAAKNVLLHKSVHPLSSRSIFQYTSQNDQQIPVLVTPDLKQSIKELHQTVPMKGDTRPKDRGTLRGVKISAWGFIPGVALSAMHPSSGCVQ